MATVAEARDQILEHLDDARGNRYARVVGSTAANYTRVDRILRVCSDLCVDDYNSAGGDRLEEEVSVTTSATDGTASLADVKPVKVRFVVYAPSVDGVRYPVDELDSSVGGLPDLSERPLVLRVQRRYELPNPCSATDLLLGTTAGAARSWPAMDEWIIARAAWMLGSKDKDPKQARALKDLVDDLAVSAMGQPRVPGGYPWPMPDNRSRMLRRLRWAYEPHTFMLRLSFDPLWRF